MKATINLGKELGYLSSCITNVFTTTDYRSELIRQYHEHVENFYGDCSNDFRIVHGYKSILRSRFKYDPCDTPLDDLCSVKAKVEHILQNRSAYGPVFKILIKDAKNCKNREVGHMFSNVLESLRKDSKSFQETATIYDRHLGNVYTVADIVNAVVAYGRLSGLVDYYQFKEGKDEEANR